MKIQHSLDSRLHVRYCDTDLLFKDYILYVYDEYINRYSIIDLFLNRSCVYDSIDTTDRFLEFKQFTIIKYKELNNYVL